MSCLKRVILLSLVAVFVNTLISSEVSGQTAEPQTENTTPVPASTPGPSPSSLPHASTPGTTPWWSPGTTPLHSTGGPGHNRNISGCPANGSLVASSVHQTLNSPGYPQGYPNNINCSWHVVAEGNSSLRINVSQFHIEYHSTCSYDALEIIRGPNRFGQRLARLCGQGSYTLYNYQVTEAVIIFRADSIVSAQGFTLTYWTGPWDEPVPETEPPTATAGTTPFWSPITTVPHSTGGPGQNTNVSGCPANESLVASSVHQTLNSPGYPQGYPNNINCSWHVVAEGNSSLRINVSHFNIEQHSTCSFDALEIIRGPNRFGQRLARLCGQGSYTLYNYQVAEAVIIFRADSIVSAQGFTLTYWSGPWDEPVPEPPTSTAGTTPWHTNSWSPEPEPEPTPETTPWHTNSWSPEPEPEPTPDTPCPRNRWLQATSTPQEILSPYFPSYYQNYANCSWHIVAPFNSSLRISVPSFQIESHSSCGYDALEIFNGYTRNFQHRLARLCGQSSYTLNNDHVTEAFVWFHTDGSITRQGFRLNFWSGPFNSEGDGEEPRLEDDPCNGTAHVLQATSDPQYLESPGYPISYDNDMDCSWSIVSPDGSNIRITLEEFQLESHSRCFYDALDIYNGTPPNNGERLASLCGTRTMVSYITQNKAFLHFHTDFSVTRPGFKLSYQITSEGPQAQPCNGGILEVQASEFPHTITSPNYPSLYQNDANCSWRIQSPPDRQVKVSLEDFRLEYHSSCNFDALEIFDGPSRTAPSLVKLCGSRTSGIYGSSSSVMYINFHSDYSVRYRGFRLSYEHVVEFHPACQGQVYSLQSWTSRRSLVSPGYPNSYFNDLECQWQIMSTSDSDVIVIVIENLRLQNSPNCSSDALELFDGNNQHQTQLGNLCGNITSGTEEFISQSSSIFVRFRSDHSQSYEGFNLTYRRVDASYIACHRGPLELQVSQYSHEAIYSPGYPIYYHGNATCLWLVESTLDFVEITVDSISSGLRNYCNGDVLQIFDGDNDEAPVLVNFCEQFSRATYVSTSKTVLIRLYSTEIDTTSRFRLILKGLDRSFAACVGAPLELRSESFAKSFSSPNHPADYPNNARCYWRITSSKPYILLSFAGYRIENHRNCGYDALEIFDGQDSSSPHLAELCGSSRSESVYISSSNVTFVYFHTDGSVTLPGFNVSYQTVEDYHPACFGRDLELEATSELKSLYSPGYPFAYNNTMHCSWKISAGVGVVSARVEDINLGSDPNCSRDRLEISDGYALLVTLCGQNASNFGVYRSTTGLMYVRFYSDAAITNRGFRLSYKREVIEGCHGNYAYRDANSSIQIIESPFYPSNYTNRAYCQWTIFSSTGYLRIYIEDASLEYDGNCYNDSLEIFRGSGSTYYRNRLLKICGQESPHLHTSIINSAYYTTVRFRSNSRITDRGFRLSFQSVSQDSIACSGNGPLHVEADSSWGTIESPNFPGAYPEDSVCSWAIAFPARFGILKIEHLRLPESSSCANTSLEIFEGHNRSSRSLARLCGDHSADSIELISLSNTTFIQFDSTGSFPNGGFELTYKSATFEEIVCTTDQVRFQATHEMQFLSMYISPYSPFNFTDCSWQIWSSTGFVRTIISSYRSHFIGEDSCSNGYLDIHDGPDETFSSLGRVCQRTDDLLMYTSSSNELYFHWNKMTALSGVSLSVIYSTVDQRFPACTGPPLELQATPDAQVIVSPGYPNNTFCRWKITSESEESFVLITVEDLRIECGHPGYDGLFMFEGDFFDMSDQNSINFCNGSRDFGPLRTIWSSSNMTTIYFRSGSGPGLRHFRLVYRSVEESFQDACNGSPGLIIAEIFQQSLESPGYPASYFNNIECSWMIVTSSSDEFVRVNFEDLRLHPDSNCSDFIELHDEPPQNSFQPLAKICGGESFPQTYWSSSRVMFVRFHTDSHSTSNGFRLTYESVDPSYAACENGPHVLRVDNQHEPRFIRSPGYPDTYPNISDCAWKIEVPSGRVLLIVANLTIDDNADCMSAALEIYDGESSSAASLATLCGMHSQINFASTSPSMYIQFHSDESTADTISMFELIYKWIPPDHQACFGPPVEVSVTSTLQIFDWSGDYFANTSVDCSWQFKSTNGFIRIMPIELHTNPSPGCSFEAVDILDGASSTSPSLAKLCGSHHLRNLASYKSTSNEVSVHVNYYNYVWMRFFYINVLPHQGCDGVPTILQAASEPKTIESPGYSHSYPNNADCTWKIQAQNGSIELYVVDLKLQGSVNCAYDSLDIFDGPDNSAPRVSRLCGNRTIFFHSDHVRSSSNTLFLHFHSDSSVTHPGFLLLYGKDGLRLPSF